MIPSVLARSPLVSVLFAGALAACGPAAFTPPDWPPHDQREDGYLHARGRKYPFLCPAGADPARPSYGIECAPRTRTPTSSGSGAASDDGYLSCDSIGCHGGYDYRQRGGEAAGRHLLGSEGPSCYACHDREWEKSEPRAGQHAFEGKRED